MSHLSSDGISGIVERSRQAAAAAEDLKAEEPYERDHKFFQRQTPIRCCDATGALSDFGRLLQ